MNRLLRIEWLKLKPYRPFWILVGLYALGLSLVCSGGMFFLEYLRNQGANIEGLDPTILPLYDFPDVWQNIAYVASIFKVFLGFIIVISVSNDADYGTLRQNVIDGMSKKEYLGSKLLFMIMLSLAAGLLLFLIGLITGSIYAQEVDIGLIFRDLEFLLAYVLSVFTYLTFALWITLLIPRTGLIIVGLFMYTLIFEPILTLFLWEYPHTPETIKALVPYFPVYSVNHLIPIPFPRYILREIQDYVPQKATLIALGWLIVNVGLSYLILKRKDW
ncbi:MAG: ABC transporter permease subunit [Saprospiraceae bacterium]|nr:ABC transporter permease subunit [Saprospiraceae bacterium]